MIAAPRVLLADEPTGNLDWDMSQRLLSLMVELNRMGTAVFDRNPRHEPDPHREIAGRGQSAAHCRAQIAERGVRPMSAISDQIVPRSGHGAWLVWLGAAAMAYLAVFALALSVSAERLADNWTAALAQSATVRISAPPAELDAQTNATLEVLRTTPGI